MQNKLPFILVAEDDDEDYFLIEKALEKNGLKANLKRVVDGEELMNYLNEVQYAQLSDRFPNLILLDLYLPKKTGIEALQELKMNENLKRIPIIILTNSNQEKDIIGTYDLGANTYIKKPFSFDDFVEIVNNLYQYWFETATLPPKK